MNVREGERACNQISTHTCIHLYSLHKMYTYVSTLKLALGREDMKLGEHTRWSKTFNHCKYIDKCISIIPHSSVQIPLETQSLTTGAAPLSCRHVTPRLGCYTCLFECWEREHTNKVKSTHKYTHSQRILTRTLSS